MKGYQVFIIGLMLTVFMIACGNPLKESLELQQAELMRLHDEVMPKSMRIDKVKKELQTYSTENEITDSVKVLIIDTSLKLGETNDEMYTWMEDFGKAMNDVPDLEEKKKLYDELQPQIEKIAKETNTYLDRAKRILDK